MCGEHSVTRRFLLPVLAGLFVVDTTMVPTSLVTRQLTRCFVHQSIDAVFCSPVNGRCPSSCYRVWSSIKALSHDLWHGWLISCTSLSGVLTIYLILIESVQCVLVTCRNHPAALTEVVTSSVTRMITYHDVTKLQTCIIRALHYYAIVPQYRRGDDAYCVVLFIVR